MEQPKSGQSSAGWSEYYERTKGQPPRKLLVESISHLKQKDRAVDLGSGAFNDVKYLLSIGFNHITAVDLEPVAKTEAASLPEDRFDYIISSFRNFDFLSEGYDLVNAQYSLPFNNPEIFRTIIEKIYDSLKPSGIFTGQFFGIKDTWNDGRENMTFLNEAQARETLSRFKIIKFEEEENDKKPAVGANKHWHVFHFIVSK